ncbi:MAG: 3-isopropylmalate dehydratase large subunit [Candidatus Omnitrophota bacterium]|nr:3-isopropylmalate dehydratase large subunit [Candidatus Omnitrophota bacterium]MBU2529154.1 3-isopropylmalate dehydratase large subunit [bacterium]MBU3930576.1 3-isopropylmalate dehydratase large subunit [bacterium]MBU4123064.1 3-isopropylmalate dehydratase large subunit [bacterium]
MNYVENILSHASGRKSVSAGEYIEARCDTVLMNDVTGPLAVKEFLKRGKKIKNPGSVVIVCDHFTPNKDIQSAENVKFLRDFAKKQKIKFFEIGDGGVEHVILPEKGIVKPGDVVIGADSHTCTYGALGAFSTGVGSTDAAFAMLTGKIWFMVPEVMEFVYSGKKGKFITGKDLILLTIGKVGVFGANYKAMKFAGPVIRALSMDERFTMCNMAIEAGGKAGFVVPDKKTAEYIKGRPGKKARVFADGASAQILKMDISSVKPLVAAPHLPDKVGPAEKMNKVKIDQAVIGSCTNGRISDFAQAAKIMKGRKISAGLRCIILPGSQQVYAEALKKGYIETFLKAGCVIAPPTCGPCLGGHMGILAGGETAISTTNRNFVGRMGAISSRVYLASPYTAAASALRGRIISPEQL